MQNKKTARVEVALDDFTIVVSGGILGETSQWTSHLSFSLEKFGSFAPEKTYTAPQLFLDETFVREYAWEEVLDVLERYSRVTVSVSEIEDIIEVEVED